MANRSPMSWTERVGAIFFVAACLGVFAFLVTPILVIVPLSFTSSEFLIFPIPGLSLRWYENFLANPKWLSSIRNTLVVGGSTTVLATALGTLAALGLSLARFPGRTAVMAVLISPLFVPVIVVAIGLFYFYAGLGLVATYLGLILAHTTLALPFVILTVSATLAGFDESLVRAAASLGASPLVVFLRVTLPSILPGVVSGALLAFTISLDEVVVTLFIAGPGQRTLPRQLFDGVRESISPTVAAVATILIMVSVTVMLIIELLRRRNERLRGRRV